MEHFHVVSDLDRYIVLPFRRKSLQCLSIGQDIDLSGNFPHRLKAFPDGKARNSCACNDQKEAEPFDVRESGVNISKLCKHDL